MSAERRFMIRPAAPGLSEIQNGTRRTPCRSISAERINHVNNLILKSLS